MDGRPPPPGSGGPWAVNGAAGTEPGLQAGLHAPHPGLPAVATASGQAASCCDRRQSASAQGQLTLRRRELWPLRQLTLHGRDGKGVDALVARFAAGTADVLEADARVHEAVDTRVQVKVGLALPCARQPVDDAEAVGAPVSYTHLRAHET